MAHPLIEQLRFTRNEFSRALKNVSEKDGAKRILPMNCISWNVGHLAWQEQKYFLTFGLNQILYPRIAEEFAYGSPASTPSLKEMTTAWQSITTAADAWLGQLNSKDLALHHRRNQKDICFGNLLLRTIYHYWYHIGENMAIRQQLGHKNLPVFVGNIDTQAPYQPESALDLTDI